MRIAVTSSDGENVDLHFGKGNSLYVYDYNEENGDLNFLEHRTVAIEEDKKEQSYLIIKAIEDWIHYYMHIRYQRRFGVRTPNEVRMAALVVETPVQYPIPENKRIIKYKQEYYKITEILSV